jgi:hypothetical protein
LSKITGGKDNQTEDKLARRGHIEA